MTEARRLLPAKSVPNGLGEREAAKWYATHDTSALPSEPVESDGPPPGPRETVSIRLTAREIAELKRRAEQLGIGHTTYVRMLVNQHVLHEPALGSREEAASSNFIMPIAATGAVAQRGGYTMPSGTGEPNPMFGVASLHEQLSGAVGEIRAVGDQVSLMEMGMRTLEGQVRRNVEGLASGKAGLGLLLALELAQSITGIGTRATALAALAGCTAVLSLVQQNVQPSEIAKKAGEALVFQQIAALTDKAEAEIVAGNFEFESTRVTAHKFMTEARTLVAQSQTGRDADATHE